MVKGEKMDKDKSWELPDPLFEAGRRADNEERGMACAKRIL